MKTVPIVGYSEKLSGRPGDRINFMVSSEHKEDFTAQLFRSVSADPNPNGQGIVEYACDDFFPKKACKAFLAPVPTVFSFFPL